MAFDGDPYRTLGLARGASLDEVKRAYRRLAKANHPDAAGSGALGAIPRDPGRLRAARRRGGRAGPKPSGPSGGDAGGSRRPSAADPDRADATRRAYGGRARPGGPRTARPGEADPPADPRRARAPGTGRRPGLGAAPETGRRRGKATLGSTSYDDATAGPFEPDWSGASWYGTTSGTYWTINPKEYADPRKHGPEYQARARRSTGSTSEGAADGDGRSQPPSHELGVAVGHDRRARRRSRHRCDHHGPDGPARGRRTAATHRRPGPRSGPGAVRPRPCADRSAGRRPSRSGRSRARGLAARSPSGSAGWSARSPAAAASPRPATPRSIP